MVPVRVEWIVTDACDPSPQVTLISATSSEPHDAPLHGDRYTTGDMRVGSCDVRASEQIGTDCSEGASGTIPTVGSAFFYLVQYRQGQSASGWWTESSPWPAEPFFFFLRTRRPPISTLFPSTSLSR